MGAAQIGVDVAVVPTGVANLASVFAAFSRLGARARLVQTVRELATAPVAVLPGVGAFGTAMTTLHRTRMDDAIVARFAEGAPTLAICLGMQLLCEGSEESPGVAGLGVVPGYARRFSNEVRTPQMGWNEVSPAPDCSLLTPGWAYFANTYRLVDAPEGWTVATTDHGGTFIAAMERGSALACQFHPELSGSWGLDLLGRWLARATAREAISC